MTGGDTGHYTIEEIEKSLECAEKCEFQLLQCNNIDNKVNRTVEEIAVYEYEISEIFKDNKVNRILKFSFLRGSNPRPYDFYSQKAYKSRTLYQLS